MLNSVSRKSEKGSVFRLKEECVGRVMAQKHFRKKYIAFKSRSDIYTDSQGLPRNIQAWKGSLCQSELWCQAAWV